MIITALQSDHESPSSEGGVDYYKILIARAVEHLVIDEGMRIKDANRLMKPAFDLFKQRAGRQLP